MRQLIKTAIKLTLPVMAGYLVLGTAFGLLLNKAGYGYLWGLLSSLIVYAGSMQFVLISFLSGAAGILSVIITTFSVNSRHIFYGISFIEKFKAMGKWRPYLIFSLTDETYSLLCSLKCEDEKEEKRLYILVSLLDQIYWVIGSVIGGILGDLITFNTNGIEFSMTALFVVIFTEQWMSAKSHIPAYVGLGCGILSRIVFGPGKFILPALSMAVVLLMVFKKKIEGNEEENGREAVTDGRNQ